VITDSAGLYEVPAGERENDAMSSLPSVSSSITVRLELPARSTAVSELTHAIEQAGGVVTALT